MQSFTYHPALNMRALAAQLRAHAADTAIEHFRRKFEGAASELDEAATSIEDRDRARNSIKLAS